MPKRNIKEEDFDQLTDVLGEDWDQPPVENRAKTDQEELDELAMAYPLSEEQIKNYENEKKRQKKGGRRQTKKRVRKTNRRRNKSTRKHKTKK